MNDIGLYFVLTPAILIVILMIKETIDYYKGE